jgi:tetratricopeptide (TPR) repeat protein
MRRDTQDDECRTLRRRAFCLRHWALLAAAAAACAWPGASRPKLMAVSLPDLARVDENVQAQARDLYASLTQKIEDRGTSTAELGAAYGRVGMLLQAAEYYDAAVPCYLNAQTLAPAEIRWPYFLGLLYTSKGEVAKAEASFTRVLDLQPDDLATLLGLGRLYFDQGRSEAAEPLFVKALVRSPRSVAALAGLGRVALAKKDYRGAVKHLEEALTIDPETESLHSPLAMAYRGLGELDKAEAHLGRWRNREIFVPDPLRQELDLLLESGLSYELRGVRALESRDWPAAASFFKKGLDLTRSNTPLRRSLQHKLGTAWFMVGDARRAEEEFEAVVRASPPSGVDESAAKAHYSLAVLMASSGRTEAAINHFVAAVKYQPNYAEAHLALADALRRSGRVEASLAHYEEAIAINPRTGSAWLGHAVALARLRRYGEARQRLTDATRRLPDQPALALALARLLAAAPDDHVRDGPRAIAIVQDLFKGQKTTDVGEAMAMALAELGEYEKAAAIQRGVMATARQAGLADAVGRMEENLRLYERRQPCRTPWKDEDFVTRLGATPPAPWRH